MLFFLLAGLLAAGICWYLNGLMVDKFERWWVIIFGPGVEEILKTGLAIILSANILLTHAVFGVVEAVRDVSSGQTSGIVAGIASLVGHCFFGYLAFWGYVRFQSFTYAIFIPLTAHLLWNGGIILLHSNLTGTK